ncbi:FAD-binding oxidoreductase [Paracoccus denitrificans]|jgi:FAD/FMN-containing dehydrogenase|uniref:FAD linked oxidase domain protein n=1 Tax=Paracoccus denitrificans (strain Pd 1222) TaxID=318586 RepID=A1BA32_PARDP|nr:FAD-binding oxidoreductase [Paracoccus denitrificans]ABL72376.1 FAD linked oxidase domain protein [Paracoccus denitrificans PD1222]MBB4628507.1 FAD/FMN-containing dehydrogenase [Paracoccus denitrificans]MCU7430191.1 FAD-binding oxidoreductase [Paracoccus denitrificans]QAR28938.1 FAD-binding oxidoreductase [Paracoccus denitrificans]UPV97091.1 FAD-binding oxidoreductase [Paracoccus denitrificans]
MLNPADDALAARLPAGVLREVTPAYLEEPRGRWRGHAGLVAAPRNTDEVASVVRACAEARVAIVPRGGGTGLVAGQVMPDGPAPLILSLERMTALRGVWPEENVLVAEAGMTLQAVRDAAEGAGRLFPLSLASQGTAAIGGCLATNAGGVTALRYGTARALCLGIEAVLPDGSVVHDLKRLRKDNTGYDLRDLLIGAEGTLGVITAASLKLVVPPPNIGTAMLQVPSPEAALTLLALAEGRMAGGVTAFELIGGQGLAFLAEVLPEIRQPLPGVEWSVLVEVGLPEGMAPEAALEGLLMDAMERGLVTDGVIAQSGAQAAGFWHLREHIPEANRRIGAVASHDISLPLSEIAGFIRDAGAALSGEGVRINCFGHLGDGNLHYNLFPAPGRHRADYDDRRKALSERVHGMVVARGGSFSAEHGVGRLKTGDLARWGDPVRLAAMRAIKAALDPLGIMNPGAVLSAAG